MHEKMAQNCNGSEPLVVCVGKGAESDTWHGFKEKKQSGGVEIG